MKKLIRVSFMMGTGDEKVPVVAYGDRDGPHMAYYNVSHRVQEHLKGYSLLQGEPFVEAYREAVRKMEAAAATTEAASK